MPRTARTFILCLLLPILVVAQTVVYNTQSGKYHAPSCRWAKKCTVNCVTISLKEAKARGGVPCKICGGAGK